MWYDRDLTLQASGKEGALGDLVPADKTKKRPADIGVTSCLPLPRFLSLPRPLPPPLSRGRLVELVTAIRVSLVCIWPCSLIRGCHLGRCERAQWKSRHRAAKQCRGHLQCNSISQASALSPPLPHPTQSTKKKKILLKL